MNGDGTLKNLFNFSYNRLLILISVLCDIVDWMSDK